MKLILSCLIFIFSLSTFADSFKAPENVSFVAWKTRKRMFLFKEVKPVGVSTNINIKKSPDGSFKLIIPKNSFNSGDSERDAEVVKILNGDKSATITFEFQLSHQDIINLKTGALTEIQGKINANENPIRVTFNVKRSNVSDNAIDVSYRGKFTDFSIEPPKVAGGAVAKVYDELKLFGTILYSDLMI